MKLRIEHTTSLAYDEPISEAYTELRLHPLDTITQRCLAFKLKTEPRGDVMQYTDRFGNLVHHFDALESHQRVVVRVLSEVVTEENFIDDQRKLSPLDEFDYLSATKYAQHETAIRDFALPQIVEGDSTSSALQLMNALYLSMKYERGATDVRTTAIEALSLGRGVCQDFAHVMLAASRCAGIPARYVSGYLYSETSEPDAAANAASHAWVDVFTESRGWISLDPTHGCEQTKDYVRVAVGRDYADVPPTRGIFKGKAKENLTVSVKVTGL
jgi:transglutaminase-like putative cysteine protease